MNVVLDTNIFRQDFFMNSSKFRILFDYLKKTDSRIKMPKIVYQEVAAVYERELNNRLQGFRKAKAALERALIDGDIREPTPDISEEVEKYLGLVKKKLHLTEGAIVPYKDDYLTEVVERAARRVKPCSETGGEFRDAVLWLTVLDIARTTDQKMLVFISNNVRQFASEDGRLHPSLASDAGNAKVTIKYYSSITDFVKDHASKIDYITSEWLVSVINLETVNERVVSMLQEVGENRLVEWAERDGKKPTGYACPVSSSMDIDDFYVYEMMDGSLYVEALYFGEVEVEFEVEEEVEESGWEYKYEFDVDEGDYSFQPVFGSRKKVKTTTKCLYPEIQVRIGMTIEDRQVLDFEITDWDFA